MRLGALVAGQVAVLVGCYKPVAGHPIAIGDTGTLAIRYGSAIECSATAYSDTVRWATPEAEIGAPGLFTQILTADFDYMIVYEPVP